MTYVAFDLLWLDGESLLDVPLLERRRLLDTVLAESELVRRGTFVRPPIGGWVRSWRAQGFVGLTFRAANSRYEPGATSTEWVDRADAPLIGPAAARRLTASRRNGTVGACPKPC